MDAVITGLILGLEQRRLHSAAHGAAPRCTGAPASPALSVRTAGGLAPTVYVTCRLPSSFSATSGLTMADPRMESLRSDACNIRGTLLLLSHPTRVSQLQTQP